MRTSFKAIIIAAGLMLIGANADAQSLKDILNKAANSSTVTEIIEGVTGVKLSKGDIKGTWSYTGSAVKLESSDLIKSATASVAATQVEKKLDEYLGKIGLKNGAFSFTFKDDNTFTTTVKGKSFNGTYTLSEDGTTITLKYGKTLASTGITATASISMSIFRSEYISKRNGYIIRKDKKSIPGFQGKTTGRTGIYAVHIKSSPQSDTEFNIEVR